jgi:hypothetical protein
MPKGVRELLAMRTRSQNRGLRRFSSTIAAMSSAEGPLGPGLRRRIAQEKSRRYLAIDQCLVQLEQGCRLTSAPQFRNPARAHEQRGSAEDEAIERGQIRRALPGSITDQKQMF